MRLPGFASMAKLLEQSASRHTKLCPRQVLGVRMGLLAGKVLGLDVPSAGKRLISLVETDGCAADGVSAATGCTVGNCRLRVVDFGKVAVTFVDMKCDQAIRNVPRHGIRDLAQRLVPDAKSRWHAQLKAYQLMTNTDLLAVNRVRLRISLEKLLSKPGIRVICDVCGEEVLNEREVVLEGAILCRACTGQCYYHSAGQESPQLLWQGQSEHCIVGW